MSNSFLPEGMEKSVGKRAKVRNNPYDRDAKPYAGMEGIVIGFSAGIDYGDGMIKDPEYLVQFKDSNGKVKVGRINDGDAELCGIVNNKVSRDKMTIDEINNIIFEYFKDDTILPCGVPCKVDIWGESGMIFIDFIVPKEGTQNLDKKMMLEQFRNIMDKFKVPAEYRRETSGVKQLLENGIEVVRYNFLLKDE